MSFLKKIDRLANSDKQAYQLPRVLERIWIASLMFYAFFCILHLFAKIITNSLNIFIRHRNLFDYGDT